MLRTRYRITVCDPIYNHDDGRYGIFVYRNTKRIISKFFHGYHELKIYLDTTGIQKSLFKVTRKEKPPYTPFCRYILEQVIENDNIRNNSK